jgi:hypothetical protein
LNGYDQIIVGTSGTAVLDGDLQLTLGFDPSDSGSDTFTIILNNGLGATTGLFSYAGNSLSDNEEFSVVSGPFSQTFRIDYDGGNGNDVVLTGVIPEPGSAALLLGGLGLLAGGRRVRRRS